MPPASDHAHGEARTRLEGAGEHLGILGAPHRMGALLEAFDRKDARGGAGREHELRVREGFLLPGFKVTHRDGAGRAVDRGHFGAFAHDDALLFAQRLRIGRIEPGALREPPGGVVGERAVRKGDAFAPLENDDLRLGAKALQTDGGADAGGDAAHDHDAHEFSGKCVQ